MSYSQYMPDGRTARVDRDLITGQWRVVCNLHGELARYGKYWTAARDVLTHRETCELGRNDEDPQAAG
jgi:hypothetical protein